ncbi:biotin/lipoyl-containing protein, partial [Micromonospora sp. NPDC005197]
MTTVERTQVFLLPDLGEGLSEAEIVEWRVAVGDIVTVDQSVVEVETAKAIVDVPCPYAGRVVTLHGAAGEVRPVGQPLITIAPLDGGDEPAGHATYREEERAGSGNVLIGYGTGHGGATRRRRRPRLALAPEPADAAPAGAVRPDAVPAAGAGPAADEAAPVGGSAPVETRSASALVISP